MSREARTPRWLSVLAGIGCSGAYPAVSNNSPYNQFKALCGRMFRTPRNRPVEGAYELLASLKSFFLLGGLTASPYSVEQWLTTMPSQRRKKLSSAAEFYRRFGLLPFHRNFTSFIKVEALPGFSKNDVGELEELHEMLDRLINGPHDVTHVIAGPYIKPICRALKDMWDYTGPVFYGSAKPEKLHKWLQRLVTHPGTYFWCDYSMMDNSHTNESWDFVEQIYRDNGIDNPDFWKVMSWWRKPVGTIGPFKYQGNVMNASGRDDTAFANALLNGFVAYVSAVAAYLAKSPFALTLRDLRSHQDDIFVSVCGDDSLGRLPPLSNEEQRRFCKEFNRNVAYFGFDAKLNLSDSLCDCVYLGNRPYQTRKGWFWGKTIGRSTYKMGYVINRPDCDALAHITGVADMHVLTSSHVPVLSDLAAKICELRSAAKRTPVIPDPEKPWLWTYQSNLPYDELTLEGVVHAYNYRASQVRDTTGKSCLLTTSELRGLIAEIQAVDTLPFIIRSPVWQRLIWADDL